MIILNNESDNSLISVDGKNIFPFDNIKGIIFILAHGNIVVL